MIGVLIKKSNWWVVKFPEMLANTYSANIEELPVCITSISLHDELDGRTVEFETTKEFSGIVSGGLRPIGEIGGKGLTHDFKLYARVTNVVPKDYITIDRKRLLDYIYDFAWHYGRYYHIGDNEAIVKAISEKFSIA